MFKYFLAWFPMLLLAILNGVLREAVFRRFLSEAAAHRLSTVTLILLFACYIWFIIHRYPPAGGTQAWMTGLMWLVLTLAFEFGFGRYRGQSWEQMFAEYNLFRGKLWILVPLWVTLAPYLMYRLYGPGSPD